VSEALGRTDGSGRPTGLARSARESEARAAGPLGPLQRFARPRSLARPGERCEMCGTEVPDEHPHVVNLEARTLLCACRACALLFTHEGAAGGRYRAVPDRYLYDPTFTLSEREWEEAQIPVDVAFFFRNSTLDRFVCFYPSPGGATESLLDASSWEAVMRANPALDPVPDVEALIVRRRDGAFQCYLVPIDACYELVGLVRLHWRGFSGGKEVWQEIERFFERLRSRSRPVGGQGS
jgi:hypothetical protein